MSQNKGRDDSADVANSTSAPAPDLQILGDAVTLQPSGYIEGEGVVKEGQEEALMNQFASFRNEPFQLVPLPTSSAPCSY